MKLKKALIAASLLAASASAGAVEFHAGADTAALLVANAGGAGFQQVSVTDYNNGRAGQFYGTFGSSSSTMSMTDEAFFRFFCVELQEYANTGPNTYTRSVYTTDAAKLERIQRLFEVAYPNQQHGDFYDGTSTTTFGAFDPNTVQAAAFQVALWEIFLDDGLSLDTGDFKWGNLYTNSAVRTTATNLLSSLNTADAGYQNWTVYLFENKGYQNYLAATRGANVPEPGSLALFGLGLAGLALRRRRSS